MPNLYSPFQYAPERGGAKILFLKYWSRKKSRETKLLDVAWRCQISIHHSSMFQIGAGLKFIFYSIGLGENFRETKLLDIVWRIQFSFYCFQYVPERGGANIYSLKYWSRLKVSGNKVVGYCLENPIHFLLFPVCSRKGRG